MQSYPILRTEIMVRLDAGGTPLHTSLATVMEGARQGGEVFERLCNQVSVDRLRVGWPREQKILKGHLPRVIYHQVYSARR